MWWLLSLYLRTLFGAYLIQLLSTFIELPSIQLSSIYLSIVGFIQSLYPEVYPKSQHYPGIREKTLGGEFVRNVDSSCHFNFLADNQYQNINAFEIASLTFKAGINAIDDLSPAFDRAPTYGESLLRFAPLPHWSMPLKILFYATLVFRLAILFPLRVAFFISSFVFIGILGIYAVFTELTDRQKTLIGPIYGKLFCLGTGTIIVGHNRQNMPRKPGIAVSNHLSPNDVQILFADLRYGDLQYVVTGQKHKGVIGLVEKMVSRLCRALWFERGNTKERMEFLTDVINMARADGPVLLFPEGYCTNNTSVLQFRKAVFEEDVNIYPIAISQSGIYGDSYWFEDKFHMYLLRLFFSWAVVYNVHYLPKMRRLKGETNLQFAQRTSSTIGQAIGLPQCQFSGSLWYNQSDKRKMLNAEKDCIAQRLLPYLSTISCDSEVSSTGDTDDSSFVNVSSDDANVSSSRVLVSVQN